MIHTVIKVSGCCRARVRPIDYPSRYECQVCGAINHDPTPGPDGVTRTDVVGSRTPQAQPRGDGEKA